MKEYIAKYFKVNPNKKGNISVRCPFHEDNNPSAGLNFEKELYNCFKCGGLSFRELYVKLKEEERLETKSNVRKIKRKTYTPELDIDLEERAVEYLQSRGIDPDNIPINYEVFEDYKSKDGKLFPYYGYIIFESIDGKICGRDLISDEVDNPARPRYLHEWGKEKGLFWIKRDESNQVVFLVEGIFDALSLLECNNNIKNIAVLGGSNLTKENVIYSLRDSTVVIILDNDPEGFKGARAVAQKFKEFEIDHGIVELPKLFGKDLNEGLINHREKLEVWISKVVDRYAPDDINYTYRLFRARNGIEALNILPTGIGELDEMLTGGFKDGGHFISGETGVGKSSFVFDISVGGVINHGKRVMINSTELSKRQSWARIASQFSQYTWEELEEDPKLLEPNTFKIVEDIAKNLLVVNGWPLKRIIQEAKNFDVIVVDYIQRAREAYGGDESATRHLVNNYASQLSDLGALQGKICLIVSSLDRGSYNKPGAFGLKESGSLEYMGASVNRISPIGDPMNGKFYWRVQKNTRGSTGIVRLSNVDLGHSLFRNANAEGMDTE